MNGFDAMKVLSVRKYRVGYEVRTEEVVMGDCPPVVMKSAYTVPAGDYVGDSKFAHRLIVQRGIMPEKADSSHNACSIGFCAKEQRWYGWSHRVMCGFGIGAVVEEGDCTAGSGWTPEYLAEHPEDNKGLPVGFVAQSLDDARRMAVAFADSVG